MTDHPYRHLPDHAFWRRAVAAAGPAIDPVVAPLPQITRDTRIATAGSCFAQHIARALSASGYHFLITEPAHPILPADLAAERGYGLFTARYGNIYTSLQLLQLIERADGRFTPAEPAWPHPKGGLADPFRPTIEPTGFASVAELETDRAHHLARVREAFETLDLFVFTLGLTECWVSREDGAAFPLCPGVAAGRFDPARYRFRNLRVAEVIAQLTAFWGHLRALNPGARMILTVSPVPLVATAQPDAHVLVATTRSKAVLRAAAQELADDHPDIHYFPSYEIVTGPQTRGSFFAEDLREVTEAGVAHVMATFLRHAAGAPADAPPPPRPAAEDPAAAARHWVQVMCDEAMLDDRDGRTSISGADG